MKTKQNHIAVFEHQILKLNQVVDGVTFDAQKLEALQNYFGIKGVPYFSLINQGIQFTEYVGVIQVGNLIIEVLPKADKQETNKSKWQSILIGMLKAVGSFDIKSTSDSNLKIKPNSILDLYIQMFINETEYLLHTGLLKQYRKKEGNVTALKGNLQFGKHIQQNLTHQERFFVRHSTYDTHHKLHFILYKTICLLKQINTNPGLHSRIGALLLHFPEMPDLKVSADTFEKLVFNRKNNGYQKAIEISKLLLMQYHPDISKGRNNVLALMFDMNKLWEKFVLVSLRKHKQPETSITDQTSKYFWQPESGYRSKIRPDIVINKDKPDCMVLDTKWKNLNGYNPSPDDLRQMYVYLEYYGAKRVALVYPGTSSAKSKGIYFDPEKNIPIDKECSIISLSVEQKIKQWQLNIYNECEKWMILPVKT